MRHDKKGFAQEAIAKAETDKQIGDYLRLLTFSAYAEALPLDISDIKNITDPFTGCFIFRLAINDRGYRDPIACIVVVVFSDRPFFYPYKN